MKSFGGLILIFIAMMSCEKYMPNTCGCIGYDAEGRISEVLCDDCSAGIRTSTCKELNENNNDGLIWQYEEAADCKIPEPPLPDGG